MATDVLASISWRPKLDIAQGRPAHRAEREAKGGGADHFDRASRRLAALIEIQAVRESAGRPPSGLVRLGEGDMVELIATQQTRRRAEVAAPIRKRVDITEQAEAALR